MRPAPVDWLACVFFAIQANPRLVQRLSIRWKLCLLLAVQLFRDGSQLIRNCEQPRFAKFGAHIDTLGKIFFGFKSA